LWFSEKVSIPFTEWTVAGHTLCCLLRQHQQHLYWDAAFLILLYQLLVGGFETDHHVAVKRRIGAVLSLIRREDTKGLIGIISF
jgi:hypothetical protein